MLKTAQIQFDPQVGKLSKNFLKATSFLDITENARLVILPELANTGYNFIDRKQAFLMAEAINKSDYIDMLVETAKSQNQFIVSGFLEKDDRELFNTSVFISPKGILKKYRKIHLFMNEKEIFSKGNLGVEVFEMDGFRLGMLICFDYLFPELWRIMGLKDADIIAHPSNLVTYKAFKVVPAQAVINRFFIFTTNRIGTERDVSFSGRSFVVDPEGDILYEASADKEEILLTEIDPLASRNKMITSKNHVFKDRFPEDYIDIVR